MKKSFENTCDAFMNEVRIEYEFFPKPKKMESFK